MPISGTSILDALRARVPEPDVVELEGIGHYPQIETPAEVDSAALLPRHRAIRGRGGGEGPNPGTDVLAAMAIPAEDPNEPGPQPGRVGPDRSPRLTDREAQNWAVAAHLAWLVSTVGIPPPIGPLVVWLIKKDDHPFVDDQGREALNFQISLIIYAVVGVVLALIIGFATLGLGFLALIPVAVLFLLLALILPIVAAIKASDGERYRYPMTLRLVN